MDYKQGRNDNAYLLEKLAQFFDLQLYDISILIKIALRKKNYKQKLSTPYRYKINEGVLLSYQRNIYYCYHIITLIASYVTTFQIKYILQIFSGFYCVLFDCRPKDTAFFNSIFSQAFRNIPNSSNSCFKYQIFQDFAISFYL